MTLVQVLAGSRTHDHTPRAPTPQVHHFTDWAYFSAVRSIIEKGDLYRNLPPPQSLLLQFLKCDARKLGTSASEAQIQEERLGTRQYRNGLCRWSAKREEEGLGSTIQGTLNTIILSVYQVAFDVIKNYFCVLDTCLRVFKALCFQVTWEQHLKGVELWY